MSEFHTDESHDNLNHPQFLVLEPTEILAAETFADGALQSSANDCVDWVIDMGTKYERFAISRQRLQHDSYCILGIKIEGGNDNDPITITRYSLDVAKRYFMVIPEHYDNVDHYDYLLADKPSEADTLLVEVGAFLPDQDDWSDFKGLLETAYIRAEVRHTDLEPDSL